MEEVFQACVGSLSRTLSSSSKPEGGNQSESEVADAKGITFGLERDLQKALRGKIGQLEPGLTIVDDGSERTTEAGRIDITARDNSGRLVAVELKAGTPRPEAITRLLACMVRWVNLARTTCEEYLSQATSAGTSFSPHAFIPDLTLRRYTFEFRFERVE